MFRKIIVAFNESPELRTSTGFSAIGLGEKSERRVADHHLCLLDFPLDTGETEWPIPGSHRFSSKTS